MKRLLLLLLALLTLLTGCYSAAMEGEPDAGIADYQTQLPEEDAGPGLSSFSLAYQKDLTMDPIACGEGVNQEVASLLYEPLFQLDETFQPVPVLCENWVWDAGGLICTITLREGVQFSDGSPLTALDVVSTLRRAAASSRYSYRLRQVAAFSARGSREVVVTLSSPNRGLPALLDIPVVKKGTETMLVPVGCGPYLFVTGTSYDYLQVNPDWWQGKSLPVDTIPLIHAKDRSTAAYLFSSWKIVLLAADPIADQLSSLGAVQETAQATTILQYVGFNSVSLPFSNAGCRAAFSRAIPREWLADALLSGHAEAAYAPISPRSALLSARQEEPYAQEAALQALASALAESGEAGHTLRLLVNTEDSFRLACAQYLADTLSLADWPITVQALPWDEYVLALTTGDFDLYYGQVRLTADWDLTDLTGTGGRLNYGGWADGETDALLSAFAAAEDRVAAAAALCARLEETAPIAPVCFMDHVVLTRPGTVAGVTGAEETFRQFDQWTISLSD